MEDEELSKFIVEKITFLIGDIDPKSVEKQLNEFDEDTIREIICKFLYTNFESNSHDIHNLVEFLRDKFERPMGYISDFYKQLSEKLNGKYSPEELEIICENEKQLISSLLKNERRSL